MSARPNTILALLTFPLLAAGCAASMEPGDVLDSTDSGKADIYLGEDFVLSVSSDTGSHLEDGNDALAACTASEDHIANGVIDLRVVGLTLEPVEDDAESVDLMVSWVQVGEHFANYPRMRVDVADGSPVTFGYPQWSDTFDLVPSDEFQQQLYGLFPCEVMTERARVHLGDLDEANLDVSVGTLGEELPLGTSLPLRIQRF